MSLLFTIGLTGIVIFILLRQKKEEERKKNNQKIQIELSTEINNFLNKTKFFTENYIRNSDVLELKTKYEKLYRQLNNIEKKYRIDKTDFFYSEWEKIIENTKHTNELFIKKELKVSDKLLSAIDGKSLDVQQRTAVVVDEDNSLVVAGAGSGKTLTIAGKVAYLVNLKGIKPEKILLITFTKKAADEMEERVIKKLGISVKVKTFHSLGLEIIAEVKKIKPSIKDDSGKIIDSFFRKEIFLDEELLRDFLEFWGIYINPLKPMEDFENLGEYINSQRVNSLTTMKDILLKKQDEKETLKGGKVKSIEELIIANYLFTNGINYEYEKKYPYNTASKYHSQYKPDFYLTDYDIYFEHFGINVENKVPWLDTIQEKKYLEGIEWKRETHKINKTKLIETYSYYHSEGKLLKKLEEILMKNEVEFNPMTYEELTRYLASLQEDKNFKELKKLYASFLTLFKSNHYNEKNIMEMLNSNLGNKYSTERVHKFLKVFNRLYKYYQKTLKNNENIDFNDMINDATELINQNRYKEGFDYIIIDEYQDISNARFKLVKAIKTINNSRIMAVGDDWQSIYRFAGSDLNLFTEFSNYFGFTETLKIEKTYRNSQDLIDIAGEFVMKNSLQLKKNLKSEKKIEEPLSIINYTQSLEQALIFALEKIANEDTKKDVMLLGRNSFDIDFLKESKYFKVRSVKGGQINITTDLFPKLNIYFLTIHKSKGLEADDVVIVNGKNDLLGFPNKISDDPVLDLVLANKEKFEFGEERRLFYVALTRTKNRALLLSPILNQSSFINELIKNFDLTVFKLDEAKEINEEITCPRCKTGLLIERESLNKRSFLGCNNYPQCNFTLNDITIKERPIRCPWCGNYMVKRKGKFGDFFGCTGFPHCKNTIKDLDLV